MGCMLRDERSSKQPDHDTFDKLKRFAFHTDGAIVVDSYGKGKVVASNWFVRDLSEGGESGGARTKSCKSVARQAGGCFTIKGTDGAKELKLYLDDREHTMT